MTLPPPGLLCIFLALPCGLSVYLPARAQDQPLPVAPRFELRDIRDATTAFQSILRDPLALEPRERLVAVYEREGLRSAAAFYAATVSLIKEHGVVPGDSLSGETWRCPVLDDFTLITRAGRALQEGGLAEAASLGRKSYDTNHHACEGAMTWAWSELLWASPTPDLAKKEVAIRALITGAEDGLPFPEFIPQGNFDLYDNLALSFSALRDPISAAVAAKRAEIRGYSPDYDVSESQLQFLEFLQQDALEKLSTSNRDDRKEPERP